MVYRDGFGQELSKRDQILIGITKGLAIPHGIPSAILLAREKYKEESQQKLVDKGKTKKEIIHELESELRIHEMESSPLENLAKNTTIVLVAATYYGLEKAGIPAYYVPVVTNSIDLIGLGTYAKFLSGFYHFKLGVPLSIGPSITE